MTFEQMQAEWRATNDRLEASIRLNTALLRERGTQRSRRALRGVSRELVFELAMNAAAVLLTGSFFADHFREVRFAIPGFALYAFAMLQLAAGIHQLVALRAIDFAEPIVEIQRRLATLHLQRVRTTKWTLLLAPLLWPPLLIVLLRALHLDAYALLGARYLAANVVVGLAAIPLLRWLATRRPGSAVLDAIAGRSLRQASQALDVWRVEVG